MARGSEQKKRLSWDEIGELGREKNDSTPSRPLLGVWILFSVQREAMDTRGLTWFSLIKEGLTAVLWRVDYKVVGLEPVKPAIVIQTRDDGILYWGKTSTFGWNEEGRTMRNSLRQVGSGVVKAYILLRFEIKNLRVQLVSFIVIFFFFQQSWTSWMQVQKRHLVEPECSLKIRSVSSSWELVRNVETQTLVQTYLVRICILRSSLCNSQAH